MRASNAGDVFNHLVTYICSLLEQVDYPREEVVLRLLEYLRNCSLWYFQDKFMQSYSGICLGDGSTLKSTRGPRLMILPTCINVAGSQQLLKNPLMESTTWNEQISQLNPLQIKMTSWMMKSEVDHPMFFEDAIRISNHNPSESPARNDPSLWYWPESQDWSNGPKYSHGSERRIPKS